MTGERDSDHSGEDGDTTLGNLPAQITRLIGREEALADLGSVVWRTRLLTLSGPGGAGKSRLAVALAEAVRADFVGGAWWVDLSATLDPGEVARVVAGMLLPDEAASDPTTAIAQRCGDSTLLVLDNCEQVIEGCAELSVALLERCQNLRVIATTRQPLGVPGEQIWRVPGLAVAKSGAAEDTAAVDGGAVELFLERAGQASSSFNPEQLETVEAVTRICRWLDGMPLAIELAAARVPVLGVAQIADRLERDNPSFLRHSSRSAPGRHQTLDAALLWSYELLEPAERELFTRLAVFRGGFSLAAAEEVCSDPELDRAQVLDLLASLVDRSLVQVVETAEQPRYRLLSTVRRYAAEQLEARGDAPAIRARHARFYYEFVKGLRPGPSGELRWLDRLELEHENLSDALQSLLVASPPDVAELASMLWPFWYRRGYYRAAGAAFDAALAHADEISPPTLLAALIDAGEVAFLQCDYAVAVQRLERALALTDELGDGRAKATALQRLGSIAREQARYAEARDLHERSLALWHELADRHGIATSQNYLGFVAWLSGDAWTGESLCTAALQAFQEGGELQDVALALINLGACALYRDEPALAAERLQEALTIARRLGFQEGVAWSLNLLAVAGRRRRRPGRENAIHLRDALVIHHQLGDRWRIASVLEEIAAAVLARQDPRDAAALLAAADALRERLRTPIPPAEAADREAAHAAVRGKLSETALAAASSDGRAIELDAAIRLAVAAIDELDAGAGHGLGAQAVPTLTARELSVLELLSAGHTNREIAAALYISPSTAGVHVSNVLRKLGAKRRVDAAGIAHKLGLLADSEAPQRA